MSQSQSPQHQQALSQQLQQVKLRVKSARFTPSGGLFNSKADIYVELSVDGAPSRKTEISKKTWQPEWNEDFDM